MAGINRRLRHQAPAIWITAFLFILLVAGLVLAGFPRGSTSPPGPTWMLTEGIGGVKVFGWIPRTDSQLGGTLELGCSSAGPILVVGAPEVLGAADSDIRILADGKPLNADFELGTHNASLWARSRAIIPAPPKAPLDVGMGQAWFRLIDWILG